MVKPGVHFHFQDIFALSDVWMAGDEGENRIYMLLLDLIFSVIFLPNLPRTG